MKISRITTHDSLRLQVRTAEGVNLNLSLSRSRVSVSGKGLTETQMRTAMTWFDRMSNDKSYATWGDMMDAAEAFLNSCKTIDQAIAGPSAAPALTPRQATVKRLAAELAKKMTPMQKAGYTMPNGTTPEENGYKLVGKYDHLYLPGMTAKQKQAIRAKARREA